MIKDELLALLDKEKEKCLQEEKGKVIELESANTILINLQSVEEWLKNNKEFVILTNGKEWKALEVEIEKIETPVEISLKKEKDCPLFDIGYNDWLKNSTFIAYIFIAAPTGMKFEIQCGGNDIEHEIIEGYYLECRIDKTEEENYWNKEFGAAECELLCYSKFDPEFVKEELRQSKEEAFNILKYLQANHFDYVNDIIPRKYPVPPIQNFTINVNYDKWYKLKESWIPISLTFSNPEFYISEAYFHMENCD